jgi:hypothetical protein
MRPFFRRIPAAIPALQLKVDGRVGGSTGVPW